MPEVIVQSAYDPLETQLRAHRSKARHTGLGGSFGGGKTRFLVEEVRRLSMKYPGNRGLLGRQDFTDLHKTTYLNYLETENWELVDQWHKTEHWIRYRNGSVVYFVGLKNWQNFLSGEFSFIAIDQAEEVEEEAVNMLSSRLRYILPNGVTPQYRMIYTFNPCTTWPKTWFIDRFDPESGKVFTEETYDYVPALTVDNPHLPAGYIDDLYKSLPPDMYDRFVNSNWEAVPGRAVEFDPNVHIVPYSDRWKKENWSTWRGIDHGSTNPTACEWVSLDPVEGDLYFVMEYSRKGETPKNNSSAIAAMSLGLNLRGSFIDPRTVMTQADLMTTTSWSVFQEYQRNGVFATPWNHDRPTRLSAWRQGLKPDAERVHPLYGTTPAPRVYIMEGACPELVRTLPKLRVDDSLEEVKKKDGDDHWFDAGGGILVELLGLYRKGPRSTENYKGTHMGGR